MLVEGCAAFGSGFFPRISLKATILHFHGSDKRSVHGSDFTSILLQSQVLFNKMEMFLLPWTYFQFFMEVTGTDVNTVQKWKWCGWLLSQGWLMRRVCVTSPGCPQIWYCYVCWIWYRNYKWYRNMNYRTSDTWYIVSIGLYRLGFTLHPRESILFFSWHRILASTSYNTFTLYS